MALDKTYKIIGILVGLTILLAFVFNISSFGDMIKKLSSGSEKDPFELIVHPSFIEEGQYDEIILDINLSVIDKNLTYLELSKEGVLVDRLNKSDQTKFANRVYKWENTDTSEYVFYLGKYKSIPYSGVADAKGYLYGCQNCFMGENSPYILTFTVNYRIGEGNIETVVKKVEIPIV